MAKLRSSYTVVKVTPTEVFLTDDYVHDHLNMTVTNDAEAVVAAVAGNWPGRRIFYRDTEGRWDELVHHEGMFIGFSAGINPMSETASEQLLQAHLQREGSGPVNDHPDGCYYCGSLNHMSDCCPNKDDV